MKLGNRGLGLIESVIALGLLSIVMAIAASVSGQFSTMKSSLGRRGEVLDLRRSLYQTLRNPDLCFAVFKDRVRVDFSSLSRSAFSFDGLSLPVVGVQPTLLATTNQELASQAPVVSGIQISNLRRISGDSVLASLIVNTQQDSGVQHKDVRMDSLRLDFEAGSGARKLSACRMGLEEKQGPFQGIAVGTEIGFRVGKPSETWTTGVYKHLSSSQAIQRFALTKEEKAVIFKGTCVVKTSNGYSSATVSFYSPKDHLFTLPVCYLSGDTSRDTEVVKVSRFARIPEAATELRFNLVTSSAGPNREAAIGAVWFK